ncbi:LuxR family transcriptional regulator [Roseisolibacter sp. H3M3-2]|uniref:LuxR family transcriptional regulator n=1 Tax=Roseisolibacter sp. H3M3-2 TaxID=3031323 RepID=UPI0023DAC7DE|nr:LuxR family transcriptional regulator [Roseisolibacter sp. H3M3-2]MDF1503771.1 LuxR C-terminal-related transcriptional regulator [Roseisolibacter sp. H3M3-2]
MTSTAVAPTAAPRRAPIADTVTLQRLERALRTLLAPLEYPDWQTWQVAVHGRLLELTGADSLCVFTPLAEGPAAWYSPHLSEEALADYGRRVAMDPAWELVETRFAALGREFAHDADLCARGELEASAFHREFLAPNRIHDLTVVGVEFGGRLAARLHFSHVAPRDDGWRERRDVLLRAVLPAFRAGLGLWRELGERRRELARMVDALPQAVLLYEASGTLLHANPGAARLLDGGPDAERLRAEAQRVAWAVGAQARRASSAPAAADLELRLGVRVVRLRGAVAPAWMLGREPGVLVTLESVGTRPLDDAELRARFALTAREVEVARLLADGLSNQEIAARLGVSFFTARNHVERLLPKLGASNRARVGALLRGEG